MLKRKPRQLAFVLDRLEKPKDYFGGSLLKRSHARCVRPLDSKLPIHLVLRARKSVLRLPSKFGKVMSTVDEVAAKYGVTIYKTANVGSHLHFALRIARIWRWAAFIRELTGRLALLLRDVLGGQKLWLYRPFTRIVRGWKKAFHFLLEYVELNQWEGEGFIKRTAKSRRQELEEIFGTG